MDWSQSIHPILDKAFICIYRHLKCITSRIDLSLAPKKTVFVSRKMYSKFSQPVSSRPETSTEENPNNVTNDSLVFSGRGLLRKIDIHEAC